MSADPDQVLLLAPPDAIVELVSISGVSDVQREHSRKRSFDQVVDVFLADCRARNLSPRTNERYV